MSRRNRPLFTFTIVLRWLPGATCLLLPCDFSREVASVDSHFLAHTATVYRSAILTFYWHPLVASLAALCCLSFTLSQEK